MLSNWMKKAAEGVEVIEEKVIEGVEEYGEMRELQHQLMNQYVYELGLSRKQEKRFKKMVNRALLRLLKEEPERLELGNGPRALREAFGITEEAWRELEEEGGGEK